MITEGDLVTVLRKFFAEIWKDQVYQFISQYPDSTLLPVDYWPLRDYLRVHEPEAEELIEQKPARIMACAQKAIHAMEFPVDVKLKDVNLQITGYPFKTAIRDIRHKHILKYICVEGIVRRVSSVKPRYTEIAFVCMRCGHITYIPQPLKKIVEPYECEDETCGRKGPWKVDQGLSTFADYQVLEIQESPDSLRGTQPRNLVISVYDELADQVTAGDKVLISGILNITQQVSKEGKATISDHILEANNIEKLDKSYDELDISQKDIDQIFELSRDPDIKNMIVQSIAPSIYGLEDVKEALALQLFSGVVKNLPDGSRIRGDIHTLMIGDPGTAKSQLVKRIVDLSPRGIFNSGKSASGVGLTAAVVKDNLNDDRWTLEGGALVLADNGLCAVDEMDKMKEDDVSAMHEAMEQQVVTVSKAGIYSQLMTRCAVVGAANPVDGRFDRYNQDIAGQINMKASLLSRFDLIFIIQDVPNKETDTKIAAHISENHLSGNGNTGAVPPISLELFRKYVAYARSNVRPKILPEARKTIEEFYVNVRNASSRVDSIPITARKIDGLYRLAEASAKTRLSEEVTEDDAKAAIRLVVACLRQIGIDEDTGFYNVDIIACGGSKSRRLRLNEYRDYIKDHNRFTLQEFGNKFGIDDEHARSAINTFKKKGDLIEVSKNEFKVC